MMVQKHIVFEKTKKSHVHTHGLKSKLLTLRRSLANPSAFEALSLASWIRFLNNRHVFWDDLLLLWNTNQCVNNDNKQTKP